MYEYDRVGMGVKDFDFEGVDGEVGIRAENLIGSPVPAEPPVRVEASQISSVVYQVLSLAQRLVVQFVMYAPFHACNQSLLSELHNRSNCQV